MANNNIFVFDVDGTLLKPSGNRIDDKGIEAIRKASKYGEVILASARPKKGITNLYSEAEVRASFIIALNGALIANNENLIKAIPIQQQIVDYFLTISSAFQNIWFFTADNWFSNNLTTPEYSVEKNAVQFSAVSLDKYNREPVLKITIVSDRNIDDFKTIFKEVEITTSNKNYFEIQSKMTNKYLACNYLYDYDFRIFAFGDSNNDYVLLKKAFFSCAVANATPKVKSVSKFISEFQFGEGVLDSVNFVTNKFFN